MMLGERSSCVCSNGQRAACAIVVPVEVGIPTDTKAIEAESSCARPGIFSWRTSCRTAIRASQQLASNKPTQDKDLHV
jgi:hypothetical protein